MVVGKVVSLHSHSYEHVHLGKNELISYSQKYAICIETRSIRFWSNKNILMLTRVLKKESNNSFRFRQSTKVQSTCRACSKIA